MHKSIIAFGLIAGGLVTGTALAAGATSPARDPAAPSGNVAAAGFEDGAAPALTEISVLAAIPFAGYGIGGRYMIPVPIPPLLHHPTIKDGWAIELGADVLYLSYGGQVFGDYHETHIVPLCGVMWNVWLTPQFAVYPKVEAGFSVRVASTMSSAPSQSGVYLAAEAGLLYRISKSITLRAELGSYGARGGVGFALF